MLPLTYTTTPEKVVTFSFTDLIQSLGYTRFYCAAARESGATKYFLTRQQVESASGYSKSQLNGATNVELNFDLDFETGLRLGGEAFFNFTQFIGVSSSVNTKIEVFHVAVDLSETSLGTETTDTRSGSNSFRELLKVTLTERIFLKGEALRICVIFTHTGANVGELYYDPSSALTKTDSDGRTVGTDISCDIPFILD